jgi:nicotinamidase-related amidase
MASKNDDLHGNVPDQCSVALILIDVINDMEFDSGPALLENALPAARRLADLRRRAKEARVPVIYVNDNFGKWRSDFRTLVDHCTTADVPGRKVARMLKPDSKDYFVLKPKQSAFFGTTLDTLLRELGTKKVILTGVAGDNCVMFSANDAYMRDLKVLIPSDCIASETEAENQYALQLMKKVVKADIRPSTELNLDALA